MAGGELELELDDADDDEDDAELSAACVGEASGVPELIRFRSRKNR